MQEQLAELVRIVSNLSDSVIETSQQSDASAAALAAIQGQMLRVFRAKGLLTIEEAENILAEALNSVPQNVADEAAGVFEAAKANLLAV